MSELILEMNQEENGGFVAKCLTESIVTQADTWEESRSNVLEAIDAFFLDRERATALRLHLVHGELMVLE